MRKCIKTFVLLQQPNTIIRGQSNICQPGEGEEGNNTGTHTDVALKCDINLVQPGSRANLLRFEVTVCTAVFCEPEIDSVHSAKSQQIERESATRRWIVGFPLVPSLTPETRAPAEKGEE